MNKFRNYIRVKRKVGMQWLLLLLKFLQGVLMDLKQLSITSPLCVRKGLSSRHYQTWGVGGVVWQMPRFVVGFDIVYIGQTIKSDLGPQ